MLGLAAAPLFPPGSPWQWKMQLVLTEKGAWFAAACAVGVLAAGVRIKRGLSSLFLALAFLTALFLFFRPWSQFLSQKRVWSEVMDRVFGPAEPPPLAGAAPAERTLSVPRPDGSSMDVVFFPAAPGAGPRPWVVAVHTGGWDGGDPGEFRWMTRRLARRGWAVAAPAYRLAPAHPWPAQREDVLLAAAWLKAHAAGLGLDPSRWALLGRSSGGQIAEDAAYGVHDPSLKGVAAFYAPADLSFAYRQGRGENIARIPTRLRGLTGGTPDQKPDVYRNASPLFAATADAPPALLMHGPRDPVTWVLQSRRLIARLAELRVPAVLIEPPWATHGFDYFPDGPGGRAAAWAVERFLSAVFGEGERPR
jgi:acetyl esterase/lipase